MANIIETDGARSFPIPGLSVEAGSIEAAEIKTGAVTEAKLGAEAVTAGKIATNAVTTVKINAEAVTTGKVALPAALPVVGAKAKGEQVLGVLGVNGSKRQVIALVAKETEKPYKITHELGEQVLGISVIKISTKGQIPAKIKAWESATKTEIELEATIADKEEFYVVLWN